MARHLLRLGLVINPLAGLGGPSALKGSDGEDIIAEAQRRGAKPQAEARAQRCLDALKDRRQQISIVTWDGAMGADVARAAGFAPTVLGASRAAVSTAEDTRAAVAALAQAGVDLLLFTGGDGTARDVCSALSRPIPTLGIPAGVKMHSGVYAVTPEAAAEVIRGMHDGALIGLITGEVRDIDESELRAGRVNSRWFGDLLVPAQPRWVQHTKIGGRESEPLALEEIAAAIAERMAAAPSDDLWVIGPGSTTAAVMAHLGLPNTLLGVDLIRDGQVLAADLDANGLLELTAGRKPWLLITFIGGQGHLLGRGNQQLTPELLRRAGRDHLVVIATRSKLAALEGRPLIVDSGDAILDQELTGHITITTGYEDQVLYPIG